MGRDWARPCHPSPRLSAPHLFLPTGGKQSSPGALAAAAAVAAAVAAGRGPATRAGLRVSDPHPDPHPHRGCRAPDPGALRSLRGVVLEGSAWRHWEHLGGHSGCSELPGAGVVRRGASGINGGAIWAYVGHQDI